MRLEFYPKMALWFRMNREQALEKFLRENIKELTDSRTTKEIVKSLRQEFSNHNHLIASERFTNDDVAELVAQTMLKARKNSSPSEKTEALLAIPFLRDCLSRDKVSQMIESESLGEQSQLTSEDIARIRSGDRVAEIERAFRDRAAEEAERILKEQSEELERQKRVVSEKEKALDARISELESIAPEANLDGLVEEQNLSPKEVHIVQWWQELKLETDPFPSNQGLKGIPESKYDDVVVTTPFMQGYLDTINAMPESTLSKTIVVIGEFGSGKTTLFEMMTQRYGRYGIVPIMTSLSQEASVPRLMLQLVSQICSSLYSVSAYQTETAIKPEAEAIDDIGRCLDVMSLALKIKSMKGFALFIDGLHKFSAHQKQNLEFLQQLQTFQERMDHKGVSCAIFVAGSLSWEAELTNNPSLSGSFYRVDRIPPLTEESAVEAVVRRIHSFVPAGKPAPTIVKAPLRTAFRVLSQRLPHPPTFRDYLDHVRDRFVARDYGNLGISLTLHAETIESINTEVLKSKFATEYSRLIDPNRYSPLMRYSIKRILPEIYLSKGIKESQPIFQRNKGAFLLLWKSGFIVRRSEPGPKGVEWHLSYETVELLENIYNKLRVAPSDALEAMFSEPAKSAHMEAETIFGPALRQMSQMAASWRSDWREISDMIEKSRERVLRIQKSSESISDQVDENVLEDVRQSLKYLMHAAVIATGHSPILGEDVVSVFRSLWCAPENVDALCSIVTTTRFIDSKLSTYWGFLHTHAQAIGDLCNLVSDLVRGEGLARLKDRLVTAVDAIQIHEARTLFLSQQYSDCVDKICESMEFKVRDIVYPALRCCFGDRYLSFLPEDIKDRLNQPPRGHPRAKREHEANFLYDISRSDYSKVIFMRSLRGVVFPTKTSNDEIERLNNDFSLLFSLGDRAAHKDKASYFRQHSTEIGDALKSAPRMLEILNQLGSRFLPGAVKSERKVDNGKLELTFSDLSNSYPVRLEKNVVEAIEYEFLELISVDPLSLPPLEIVMNSLHYPPELIFSVLLLGVEEELVTADSKASPFVINLSITEKGRRRLEYLRRLRSSLTSKDAIPTRGTSGS